MSHPTVIHTIMNKCSTLMLTATLADSLKADVSAGQWYQPKTLDVLVVASSIVILKPLIADYSTAYKFSSYPRILSAHNGQDKKKEDGKTPLSAPPCASNSEGDHLYPADQSSSGATPSGAQGSRDNDEDEDEDEEPVRR